MKYLWEMPEFEYKFWCVKDVDNYQNMLNKVTYLYFYITGFILTVSSLYYLFTYPPMRWHFTNPISWLLLITILALQPQWGTAWGDWFRLKAVFKILDINKIEPITVLFTFFFNPTYPRLQFLPQINSGPDDHIKFMLFI